MNSYSYNNLCNSITEQNNKYSFCEGHITAKVKADGVIKIKFGNEVPAYKQDEIKKNILIIVAERTNHVAQNLQAPHHTFNAADFTLPTIPMRPEYIQLEKNDKDHPNGTEMKQLIKAGKSLKEAKRKADSVAYFEENQLKKHKVTIDEKGKLKLPKELKKEKKLIYVMNEGGELFVANEKKKVGGKKIKHSSFLGGDAVACAGKLEIKDKKIKKIDNSSGHYQPTKQHLENTQIALAVQGVKVNKVEFKNKSK